MDLPVAWPGLASVASVALNSKARLPWAQGQLTTPQRTCPAPVRLPRCAAARRRGRTAAPAAAVHARLRRSIIHRRRHVSQRCPARRAVHPVRKTCALPAGRAPSAAGPTGPRAGPWGCSGVGSAARGSQARTQALYGVLGLLFSSGRMQRAGHAAVLRPSRSPAWLTARAARRHGRVLPPPRLLRRRGRLSAARALRFAGSASLPASRLARAAAATRLASWLAAAARHLTRHGHDVRAAGRANALVGRSRRLRRQLLRHSASILRCRRRLRRVPSHGVCGRHARQQQRGVAQQVQDHAVGGAAGHLRSAVLSATALTMLCRTSWPSAPSATDMQ